MPEAVSVRVRSMLPGSSGARVTSFIVDDRLEVP